VVDDGFCFCSCFCLRFVLGKIPRRLQSSMARVVFLRVFCCFALGVWCWCSGFGVPVCGSLRMKAGQWGAYDSTMPRYLANTFAASAHPSTVSSWGRPQGVCLFVCLFVWGGGSPRRKAGQWSAYDSTMPWYLANTSAASAHSSTVSTRGRPQSVISPRLNQNFKPTFMSSLTFPLV
jgi:hypothetical protein